MVAILGLEFDMIQNVFENQHLMGKLYLSVCNSKTYHCISYENVKQATFLKIFKRYKARFISLPNIGPYYSPLMKDAANAYKSQLDTVMFKSPNIIVLSNYKAIPYTVTDLKLNLYFHLMSPILWYQSINFLFCLGEKEFVECSSRQSLLKYIQRFTYF